MKREKTLSLFDMLGISLAGFVSLELLASQAMLGTSIVGAFFLLGGSYVLTHCLICAELGSNYPDQGGIYAWVKRGLGTKWAARTSWWYWLSVVGFVPSIMIPTISIFNTLFNFHISSLQLVIFAIIGTWLIMILTMLPLKNTKFITNIGTIAKVSFCLIVIFSSVYITIIGKSQVHFTFSNIMPKFNWALLALIPTFTYGLSGMDLIACMSDDMKDPKKDIPKAMIIATIVAMGLYIFSIVAIQIILPHDEINETTGLINAVMEVFGGSLPVIFLIGACLVLVYLSNGFAWPLAANTAAQEAAKEGDLPKVFATETKHGSPLGGPIIMGIASTVLIIFYGFVANSNEGLFWTILAFTGMVFFMPYIMVSFAYLALRKEEKLELSGFRIKDKLLANVVGIFHGLFLIGSFIAFLIPPEGESPLAYVAVLVSTLLASQVVGELVIKRASKT